MRKGSHVTAETPRDHMNISLSQKGNTNPKEEITKNRNNQQTGNADPSSEEAHSHRNDSHVTRAHSSQTHRILQTKITTEIHNTTTYSITTLRRTATASLAVWMPLDIEVRKSSTDRTWSGICASDTYGFQGSCP